MLDKKANIIFDLDGTLIDSSERLYQLFQNLVPESKFTKEEYWKLKRNKFDHKMILEKYFTNKNYEDFNSKWMQLIEDDNYLNMDKNYFDTINILDELSSVYNVILFTARQSKEKLYCELERLDIKHYFNMMFITEGKIAKEVLLEEMLSNGVLKKTDKDIFIGDIGKDILVGSRFGYKTVAITHGFMNRRNLCKYNPDILIDNLFELCIYVSEMFGKN